MQALNLNKYTTDLSNYVKLLKYVKFTKAYENKIEDNKNNNKLNPRVNNNKPREYS